MLLDDDRSRTAEEFAQALIPVYPATKDLRSWQIANVIGTGARRRSQPPTDPMPTSLRAEHGLMDLRHGAAGDPPSRPRGRRPGAAQKRLKWDEALAVQVSLVQRKLRAAAWPGRAAAAADPTACWPRSTPTLPYTLTPARSPSARRSPRTWPQAHPMHRLLQGEVGSGKTLCALRGMLQVVDAGGQAALLAPTEVLAAQHYRSIRGPARPDGAGRRARRRRSGHPGRAGDRVRRAAAARRQALAAVASGEAGIVVGTHALLYEGVDFADLGLVVVDEQHRFGVEQRDALRAKADATRRMSWS